jgi:hypothetical protein
MRKEGAHEGLNDAPVLRVHPPPTARMLDLLDKWTEGNNTAFSHIVELCENSPDAMLVCDSYFELRQGINPPVLCEAKQLMENLMIRFQGQTQERLEGYMSEYAQIMVKYSETPTVMIDRLSFLILKLTQLKQPPTAASKVEKLKSAVKLQRLKGLVGHIAMQPTAATFDDLCTSVKQWDKAFDGLDVQTPSVNHIGFRCVLPVVYL